MSAVDSVIAAGLAKADAARRYLALTPTNPGYDLIALLGQSNMIGGETEAPNATIDLPHPRVWQWPGSGSFGGLIIPGSDPLFHQYQAPQVGPGMTIARAYARQLQPYRDVLLVPAAKGTTGFTPSGGFTWDPADTTTATNLYTAALAQIDAALVAAGAGSRLVGVMWVQGENDGAAGMNQATYAAKLDSLIAGLRTHYADPNLPFVVGQTAPTYIAANSFMLPINAALIDTPRRVTGTAFAYGPTAANSVSITPIHYSNAGARALGANMAVQLLRFAKANVTGAAPVAPAAVNLTQSATDTTITVAWTRSPGRATDYLVEYKVGAGSWTTLTRAQSIDHSATITGQTVGAVVQARVSTKNEQGTSSPTTSSALTVIAAAAPLVDAVGVTAFAAWSLRKVRSAYAGKAISVRRTSDSTTADIGFTVSGLLDTTALLAFVGGGSGFIATWYDQSGNGRDLTQATAAAQPRIVNAGVIDTVNSLPAAYFGGAAVMTRSATGLYAGGASSQLSVVAPTTFNFTPFTEGSGSGSARYMPLYVDGNSHVSEVIRSDAGFLTVPTSTIPLNTSGKAQAVSTVDTGTTLAAYVDGATVIAPTAYTRSGTFTLSNLALGGWSGSVNVQNFLNGWLPELVLFGSALSDTARQAGQANLKTLYATS